MTFIILKILICFLLTLLLILRDVLSSAAPFSLINTLPNEMPDRAENWQNILNDIETFLLPALTHWQSPNFHGFYPSGSSMGSIVGELLIAGIGVLGFNWVSTYFSSI